MKGPPKRPPSIRVLSPLPSSLGVLNVTVFHLESRFPHLQKVAKNVYTAGS